MSVGVSELIRYIEVILIPRSFREANHIIDLMCARSSEAFKLYFKDRVHKRSNTNLSCYA